MNSKTFVVSLLFVLSIFFSCKGQQKTENASSEPVKEAVPVKTDYDPYFIETDGIHQTKGPSSITRNILEDKDGNMWFASWEGIMRYEPAKALEAEGKPFTNFTNKEGLRRYHVFSVLRDRRENLWFGTIRGGIYRYDPSVYLKTPATAFINLTTKQGLADDAIGCMLEDRAGNIWIGTFNGLSFYDPKISPDAEGNIFQNYIMEGEKDNSDINSIVEDRNGTFWFGTRGEVFCYDGKSFTAFKDRNGLPLRNVRSIIEDKEGKIWLGGNEGLWSYDPAIGVTSFTLYTRDFAGYIYEDSKGNIWAGTNEPGERDWVLTRYDQKTLANGSTDGTRIHKQKGQIFGILEDSKGNIWFGNERGACRFDPTTGLNALINLTELSVFECFQD